jgi:hypothetical protein
MATEIPNVLLGMVDNVPWFVGACHRAVKKFWTALPATVIIRTRK